MGQQAQWKYCVLVDGNVGASRLGELSRYRFVVLWVASTAPQVALATRLRPWMHYVPLRSDLEDLETSLLWLRNHDNAARVLADTLHDCLHPLLQRGHMVTSVRHTIRSLPEPAAPEEDMEAQLRYVWDTCRSAIYVLMDNRGNVILFRPFAHVQFRNTWGALTFEPAGLQPFLEHAQRLFPSQERIIPDTARWWSNAGLVCNVMPPGGWGESLLPELYELLCAAGQRARQ